MVDIPAHAGISFMNDWHRSSLKVSLLAQGRQFILDSRFRGNDV
jgi:hypothetical protein